MREKRQLDLYAYIGLCHFGQQRKYTGEPYISHLAAVAEMADGKCLFGYEIGLCHDLFEDTPTKIDETWEALIRFGYSKTQTQKVLSTTIELTDQYTHQAYPNDNRARRKQLEAERLWMVSYEAQTVKYADMIDNTASIVEHDKGFAKIYLSEKIRILSGMNNGNPELLKLAKKSYTNAIKKLEK